MHLSANVLLQRLLPAGTVVRRYFSFEPNERRLRNSLYRQFVRLMLARRHQTTDFFFSLLPLEPPRLQSILDLARKFVVEVETHPVNPEEYRFLMEGEVFRWAGDVPVAPRYVVPRRGQIRAGYKSRRLPRPSSAVQHLFADVMTNETKHISVCICTYRRPGSLKRLLRELDQQDTGGLFTYSIVVADNDHLRSAEAVVSDFAAASIIPIKYSVEPQQNIALARNKAIENANGDFVAFIDDDEFPTKSWLLTLFKACNEFDVDGVLGPVKPHFAEQPPKWVVKGRYYERPTYPTGFVIDWRKGRSGNVLLKTKLFAAGAQPFRPEFLTGEDQDFFRRMIDKGHVFIWCDEAVAYEVVPPIRWKRTFMLKRALLRGAASLAHPTFGALEVSKSVIAVPAYIAALPFALVGGHHRFMTLFIKVFDHLGKLLALLGIKLVRQPYVTD